CCCCWTFDRPDTWLVRKLDTWRRAVRRTRQRHSGEWRETGESGESGEAGNASRPYEPVAHVPTADCSLNARQRAACVSSSSSIEAKWRLAKTVLLTLRRG